MTVYKLHGALAVMIAAGQGRLPVCIDKPSFRHNCESDGCVILDVEGVAIRTYNRIGDDGGLALRADGSERMLTSAVLDGGCGSSFEKPSVTVKSEPK